MLFPVRVPLRLLDPASADRVLFVFAVRADLGSRGSACFADLNHAPGRRSGGQSSFQGLVMVDTEGYVVWYHDAGAQVLAFDVLLLTHDVAMVVLEARALLSPCRPNGNARLVWQTCGDDPLPTAGRSSTTSAG